MQVETLEQISLGFKEQGYRWGSTQFGGLGFRGTKAFEEGSMDPSERGSNQITR